MPAKKASESLARACCSSHGMVLGEAPDVIKAHRCEPQVEPVGAWHT